MACVHCYGKRVNHFGAVGWCTPLHDTTSELSHKWYKEEIMGNSVTEGELICANCGRTWNLHHPTSSEEGFVCPLPYGKTRFKRRPEDEPAPAPTAPGGQEEVENVYAGPRIKYPITQPKICSNCGKPKNEHRHYNSPIVGMVLWCDSDTNSYRRYKETLPCESLGPLCVDQEPRCSQMPILSENQTEAIHRLHRLQAAKTELEQAQVADPSVTIEEIMKERERLFGHLPPTDIDKTLTACIDDQEYRKHLQFLNQHLCDTISQMLKNRESDRLERYNEGYKNGKDDGRMAGIRIGSKNILVQVVISAMFGFAVGSLAGHFLIH